MLPCPPPSGVSGPGSWAGPPTAAFLLFGLSGFCLLWGQQASQEALRLPVPAFRQPCVRILGL